MCLCRGTPASYGISSWAPRVKVGVSVFITGDPGCPPHPASSVSASSSSRPGFPPEAHSGKGEVARPGTANREQLRGRKGTATREVGGGLRVRRAQPASPRVAEARGPLRYERTLRMTLCCSSKESVRDSLFLFSKIPEKGIDFEDFAHWG